MPLVTIPDTPGSAYSAALTAVAAARTAAASSSGVLSAASANLVASGLACDTNGRVRVAFKLLKKTTASIDYNIGFNGSTANVSHGGWYRTTTLPNATTGTGLLVGLNGGVAGLNAEITVEVDQPQSSVHGESVSVRFFKVAGWCWTDIGGGRIRCEILYFGSWTGTGELTSIGLYGSTADTEVAVGSSREVEFPALPF